MTTLTHTPLIQSPQRQSLLILCISLFSINQYTNKVGWKYSPEWEVLIS